MRPILRPIVSPLLTDIASAARKAFSWPSLFADGTPGFRINVEEAIRLNKAAIGSKTSGFTPEELAACVAFQDSAGTLPVTAMEQSLELILDTKLGVPVLGPELTAQTEITLQPSTEVSLTWTTSGTWYYLDCPVGCQLNFGPGWNSTGNATGLHYRRANGLGLRIRNFSEEDVKFTPTVREIPGNHFIQPSNTASRPIVSRRVNRLTNTGFTLGAVGAVPTDWIERGNVTGRVIEDATAPSGRAMRVTVSAGGGLGTTSDVRVAATELVAATYRVRVLAKRVSGTSVMSVAAPGLTPSAIELTDQYAWYEATMTPITSGHNLFFGAASAITYDIAAIDVRLSSDVPALPPYQRVTSPTDYDESGFPAYARFDGLDDWLETAGAVDMTSTDEVTVIAGVTKLRDAAAGIVIESSVNATSNAGAIALYAPDDAAATYEYTSRGTASADATASGQAAPRKSLLSGVSKISTDTAVLRINGVQAATSATDQGTGNYGAHKFYMGRRGGVSLPFNGRLYGVTVVGKLLTDGQLAAVEQAERQLGRLY